MDNPNIRIESDGITTAVHLNGKHIRTKELNFHADSKDGLNIRWDGILVKENKDGEALIQNEDFVTEKFSYTFPEEVVD